MEVLGDTQSNEMHKVSKIHKVEEIHQVLGNTKSAGDIRSTGTAQSWRKCTKYKKYIKFLEMHSIQENAKFWKIHKQREMYKVRGNIQNTRDTKNLENI